MKSAPKPPNEKTRLESLRSLNILDTLPEKDFDEIVFLASKICEAPIALISLIDENRQWFKAKTGTDATETHRDLAFCAHAILKEELLIVPDSSKDERFADNPLVTGGPQVKFYAGAPLKSPDGHAIGTVCVIDSKARELTPEQQRALTALSNQVTRLLEIKGQVISLQKFNESLLVKKTALDNISEGVVLHDQTGAILDFNQAALDVLGLTAGEITGKTSMDPSWKATREDGSPFPGNEHPAMVTLATGKRCRNVIMGVERNHADRRWIQINSVPLFLKEESGKPDLVVASFADITSVKNLEKTRRELEIQIQESARLSSLGIMAAGVAHEINNPLAVLSGKAKKIRRILDEQLGDPHLIETELGTIDTTVERIAKIIKGLKTYSRDASGDPFVTSNLKDIIDDTLSVCAMAIKKNDVTVTLECESNLSIHCRPAQISQVILNLITNAVDAISEKNEKWVQILVHSNAKEVQIDVVDCGTGIQDSVVQKIMTPFFTTKEVGKGTGLGLSISKGIAEVHGGTLEYVRGEPHTTFRLKLPLNH